MASPSPDSIEKQFKVVISVAGNEIEKTVTSSINSTAADFIAKVVIVEAMESNLEGYCGELVCLAVVDGSWFIRMKDETIAEYLNKNDLSDDGDGFHFMVIRKEDYNHQTAEADVDSSNVDYSSSDGETDSSTDEGEGEATDDDDDKSGDGQDKPDGGYPDKGGSSSTQIVSTTSIPVIENFSDAEFEVFVDEIASIQKSGKSDVLSLDDLIHLRSSCDDREKYFHKFGIMIGKAKKKMKSIQKMEKKAIEEEQKKASKADEDTEPQFITLNVDVSGKMFSIQIQPSNTVKGLRDEFFRCFPKVATKKMLKRGRWMVKDKNINDTPRKTLGIGKTQHAGLQLKDGSVVRLVPEGAGGGKRSKNMDTAKDKSSLIKDYRSEIEQTFLHISAYGCQSPTVEKVMGVAVAIKNDLVRGSNNTVSQLLKDASPDTIFKLQTGVLPSSTRPMDRAKSLMEIIFNDEVNALDELQSQTEKVKGVLLKTVYCALIAEFGDGACNISWQSFSEALVNSLKEKASISEGAVSGEKIA